MIRQEQINLRSFRYQKTQVAAVSLVPFKLNYLLIQLKNWEYLSQHDLNKLNAITHLYNFLFWIISQQTFTEAQQFTHQHK